MSNTTASLKFYRCHSCSIQPAGSKIEKESLVYVIYIIYCSTILLIFRNTFKCKSACVFFSSSLRSRKCQNYLFMFSCIYGNFDYGFLNGGEKWVSDCISVI